MKSGKLKKFPTFVLRYFVYLLDMRKLKLITESIDLSGVGKIDVTWNFDKDDYLEWLNENGYEINDKSLNEYIKDYVDFELEYFDNDTYHHMAYENVCYSDLADSFGEEMANRIVKEIRDDGQSTFETQELYNSQDFDVNNPDELNNIAMKILNYGNYYKGCRGFILTNGVIVYTPAEHNMVSQINGIKDTFDFIKKGNIRILNQSIDLSKEPTTEQRDVLRQVIASYSDEELYLDILTQNGEIGAHYNKPDWRMVMGEIDRFFDEGIKPQGGYIYESLDTNLEDVRLVGACDDMKLIINGKQVARYFYEDSTAYPFIIYKDKLYIGNKRETHMELAAQISCDAEDKTKSVCGRIWVSAKVNEFNHSVVGFWGDYCGNKNCKPYVYEVAKKLKVDPNKIVIAVDYHDNIKITPLSEWDGVIHKASEIENQKRNLHIMKAREKHDSTEDFRNSRDKKLGKKLIDDSGKEMPMAQYHNLLYQENKNIIVSEEQYNKLFKKKVTEVKINEGQFNRLFDHLK